ncbi:MAG: asparaginase domain-containing protein, partial [Candidatus Wallbacteria bacterium]|nr:asparaginase domain-containing protein [Candidatus Wallbacteria bacterium]
IQHETRRWNENRGRTESMRSKELALDYRYLQEPDLAVVRITQAELKKIGSLPELPDQRLSRYISGFRLSRQQAWEIVADLPLAVYFEACHKLIKDAELTANWMLNQVRSLHRDKGIPIEQSPISPERLAGLLLILKAEGVSAGNARKVLELMFDSSESAEDIIKSKNLDQCSDRGLIQSWVEEVLSLQPDALDKFQQGKTKIFQFLLGKVHEISRGKVNPVIARELLLERLPVKRVCVVDMGGAISAVRDADGTLAVENSEMFSRMVASIAARKEDLKLETVTVSRELSENLSPREWFELIELVRELQTGDNYKGIVITHGLDTLSYTASLIRWCLPGLTIPVIFTGAALGPDDEGSDAQPNLTEAVEQASHGASPGIWVSLGGKLLPAVNLQMTGVGKNCLCNRNFPAESNFCKSVACGNWPEFRFTLEQLSEAVSRTMLIKVYPGLNPKWIEPLSDSGVKYLILELFDTGTANTRWGSGESLLPLISKFQNSGGAVFCTSQLSIPVNVSEYESSRDLWNAGIVPMGRLVTESAYTKLISLQLCEQSREAIIKRMIGEEFYL